MSTVSKKIKLNKSDINKIARCQINHRGLNGKIFCGKKNCPNRFVCFTNELGIDDVFHRGKTPSPKWLAYVKNDEEGRAFVALLRKSINKNLFGIKVRGRAKNRKEKGGTRETQPLKTADYLAIYLNITNLASMAIEYDLFDLFES